MGQLLRVAALTLVVAAVCAGPATARASRDALFGDGSRNARRDDE